MKSPSYRIFHKTSDSDATLIFYWDNGQVRQHSLVFVRGNILDLVIYKRYQKHARKFFLKILEDEKKTKELADKSASKKE